MPEAKLLLDIINKRQPLQFVKINYEKLIELANFHNLTALIFYKLQEHAKELPQNIYLSLKSCYLNNISINLKLWQEFLKINEAFKENNIPLLPLKGIDILARFYPSFDLRNMVDIDILIKKEHFAEIEKALSSLGYQKNLLGLKEEYWRKHQCHIAFYKDYTVVEAHWGLDFKRGNRVILPRLWERAKEKQAGNHKITILSPEDAIFSFALHLRRFGNILSLKQAFDVAKTIKESPGFDWDYVLKECKTSKIKATLYFILMQVCLFTETNIPPEIFKKLNLPCWQKMLIKKLILQNTFQIPPSLKNNYLKAHFLLYDNLCEPILYLINIPYEQFCKFYTLKPYTLKSNLLYGLRLFYIPVSRFYCNWWAR
jgi:hypothetical protein